VPAITPPLVSIVTPSFNQARYLSATLESVAMQDYPRVEHIVMDGGSTDGSVDIIRSWAETHPIIWRSGPDGGQAAAIQAGARLASGEILAWLNSDDVYLDERAVSDMVAALSSGAEVVTAGGWHLTEDGTRLSRIPVHPDRLGYDVLRCIDWVLQPATFFRRELILRHPLDESLHFAFDWDFFIRVARETRIVPIDRDLAGYRLHETGKSLSGGTTRRKEVLEVTRRYNGARSPRYLLLRAVSAVREGSERLPEHMRERVENGLGLLAWILSRATGGRGIQS
jgi:glycosyltransferase involved in cell wall biosynthesis